MNMRFYFHVFKELIAADLSGVGKQLLDKVINVSIWAVITLLIFAYIMPAFGLKSDFGIFQFGGVVASMGLFEMFPSAVRMVSDFENEKTIFYKLTLPIPSWVALLSKVCYYAINALVLGVCIIPVSKLILWNQLDFNRIAWFKLISLLLLSSLFYGILTLWLASKIQNMTKIQNVWMRCIFPLWFLGGFQFSWLVLYKQIPFIAYLNLLNPIIYITEASRAAILGQEGYLNFWLCILAIATISVFCLWSAISNLKRRLDFV